MAASYHNEPNPRPPTRWPTRYPTPHPTSTVVQFNSPTIQTGTNNAAVQKPTPDRIPRPTSGTNPIPQASPIAASFLGSGAAPKPSFSIIAPTQPAIVQYSNPTKGQEQLGNSIKNQIQQQKKAKKQKKMQMRLKKQKMKKKKRQQMKMKGLKVKKQKKGLKKAQRKNQL
jgi:hypothetical protein